MTRPAASEMKELRLEQGYAEDRLISRLNPRKSAARAYLPPRLTRAAFARV